MGLSGGDYRALIKFTIKDTYPLLLIEECLDTLVGNQWFSKLDANVAYWQIKIHPEDCFEFTRMGFGLCNAPATFARAINLVLNRLIWKIALAFLGPCANLNYSETHLDNPRQVCERFRQYGLKIKPKKPEY